MQIHDLDKEAKREVTAIYHFDAKHDKYDVDIVVREKTGRFYLYEMKFMDPKNKKSSKQSSKEYSEPSALKGRDVSSNSNIPQTKHSVNDSVKNNLSKSDVKYSYAGINAKIANVAKLWKAV